MGAESSRLGRRAEARAREWESMLLWTLHKMCMKEYGNVQKTLEIVINALGILVEEPPDLFSLFRGKCEGC